MGAVAGLDTLQRLLPGGTFISFTVLAQLTTSSPDLADKYAKCQDKPDGPNCSPWDVCGHTAFPLTVALVAITAMVCLLLGWWNATLEAKGVQKRQEDIRELLRRLKQHTKTAATASTAAAVASEQAVADIQQATQRFFADGGGSSSGGDGGGSSGQQTGAPLSSPSAAAGSDGTRRQSTFRRALRHLLPRSASDSRGLYAMHSDEEQPLDAPLVSVMSERTAGAVAEVQELEAAEQDDPLKSKALDGIDESPMRAFLEKLLRTLGGTLIFLVLALFTPPVSTCLLPTVNRLVITCVPVLVAFFVSGLLVVLDQLLGTVMHVGPPLCRSVFFVCCWPAILCWRCLPCSKPLAAGVGKSWAAAMAWLEARVPSTAEKHFCNDPQCRGSSNLTPCDICGKHFHERCSYPDPSSLPQPRGGWLCKTCNTDANRAQAASCIQLHGQWITGGASPGQVKQLPGGRLAVQFAKGTVSEYDTPEQLEAAVAANRWALAEDCPSPEVFVLFRDKKWLQMRRQIKVGSSAAPAATRQFSRGVTFSSRVQVTGAVGEMPAAGSPWLEPTPSEESVFARHHSQQQQQHELQGSADAVHGTRLDQLSSV